ncbi:hypothetical protein L596_001926 [Steinernema carpocapsae]|uniref:Uncharacterized protein n=1 Tax=Steinernema carpocapsae TaxID=34508 RepID=A0A4U8UMI7_STECR|nr:hypothetical protein L596_001926 [Steinernema carpocapsae]
MKIGSLALLAFATLVPLCASTGKISMCQYCASQDFFDNALKFVERQVINGRTRTKYISDRDCKTYYYTVDYMREIECLGRCFTMFVNYTLAGSPEKAEVRSCEALHFNQDERELYNENRCYEREFKGKKETFCFCDHEDHCNWQIVTKNGQKMILDYSIDEGISEEGKYVDDDYVPEERAGAVPADNVNIVPQAFDKRADAMTQDGDEGVTSGAESIFSQTLFSIAIASFVFAIFGSSF